jgi:hypothetical protein
MRSSHSWLAAAGVTLGIAGVSFYGHATAEETSKREMHTPQKAIQQPFLDGLLGSWTTESVATHEGKELKGTGKATYSRAVGSTAILQVYENTGPGPDGKTMTFHGHGLNRLSDDGQTLTIWWFCNMFPDAMKLSGPINDSGFKVTGESPHGGQVTLSYQKTADGLTLRMTEGANEMKETYKRVK